MRRAIAIAAISFLAIFPPRHAAADADADVIPGSQFSVGKYWQGAAYAFSGVFAYCAISGVYNSTVLSFGLTKNFEDFMLSLGDNSWTLPQDHLLYATISVDGKWSDSYKGISPAPKLITFHFNGNADFMKAIALGRTLRVTTSKQAWTFNLLGTEAAMPQLVKCAAAYSDEAGSNPFDGQAPATTRTRNPFDAK